AQGARKSLRGRKGREILRARRHHQARIRADTDYTGTQIEPTKEAPMPDSTLLTYQPESLEGKVSDAEWQMRVDMAACYRVAYHYGWNDTIHNHLSARVPDEPEKFLMNPQGLGWHE